MFLAPEVNNKPKPAEEIKEKAPEGEKIDAQTFTFRELATATKNFRQECLLGEGGFGKVFKATLQSTGQVTILLLSTFNFFVFLTILHRDANPSID